MEWALVAATLVGGLAALWFFWDKIKTWWSPPPQTPPKEPEEKLVEFNYPVTSGLQANLEAQGYIVSWCPEKNLARRLEQEGYELALQEKEDGTQVKLTTGDCVLVKKRKESAG